MTRMQFGHTDRLRLTRMDFRELAEVRVRRATILIFAFLVASMIAGCGGSDSAAPAASAISSPETTTTTAAPAPDITISNYTFTVRGPVKPGQEVTIVNDDDASHSVAVDVGDGFDTRVSGGGGVSTFTAPSTPGTYAVPLQVPRGHARHARRRVARPTAQCPRATMTGMRDDCATAELTEPSCMPAKPPRP